MEEGTKWQLTGLTSEHRRYLWGFPDINKGGFGFGSVRVWRTSARGVFKNQGKPQVVLACYKRVSYHWAPVRVSAVAMGATERELDTSSFEPIKDSASLPVWSGETLDTEVGALGAVGKPTQHGVRMEGPSESGWRAPLL